MKRLQKNRLANGLFSAALRFSAWLQALPARATPPAFRLMQVSTAFWQSRALYAAAKIDIATSLGESSMASAEIAARVGADAASVARLLRYLAAGGIFAETAPGTFANNTASRFLRGDVPGNLRALVLMHNSPDMTLPWVGALEDGIRQGRPPFELEHGTPFYRYLAAHPLGGLFSEAMDAVEALVGDGFATDFDWSGFDRIIDVGGANGSKAAAVLKRHPHLRALVFDRPEVITGARQRIAPTLAERMDFVGGDMFSRVPAAMKGDVYLLSAILHGFDDDACAALFARLGEAGPDTAVVAMEMVLDERHPDLPTTAFDMQMLMATGGRERTLREWSALAKRCGYDLTEVVATRSLAKLIVFRPRFS